MLGEPLPAVLVRWGTFVALLTTIGAAAFGIIVLGLLVRRSVPTTEKRDGLDSLLIAAYERHAARFGFISAIALVPLAVGRLMIQVAELREAGESWTDPATMMLLETTWGVGWWTQVGAALVCAIGFALVRRHDIVTGLRRRSRSGWILAAGGAVTLALTPALSGHASGTPRFTVLAIVGDTLHVLGAGVWLGSLAVMFGTVIRARPQEPRQAAPVITTMLRAFSPVALVAAGLVLTTGVVASWLHAGRFASLWETAYGRLLVGKVALFSVVVILGAWNWRRLTPRLQSNGDIEHLDRAVRAELLTALLVLLATAVLVATPLPGE